VATAKTLRSTLATDGRFVLQWADYTDAKLNGMKMKELKQLANMVGEKCKGCVDKEDYVKLAKKIRDSKGKEL
jgi:hypothetical protein